MKARTQNTVRAMVAMMVMAMTATSAADAARSSASNPSAPRDPRVDARVVAAYYESAWLAPSVVVLDSKKAWDEWNMKEVNEGRAVAAEMAPADVNWGSEVLMVVALGENPNARRNMNLDTCTRKGTDTEVAVNCSLTDGGSSPSLVLALPRGSAHSVNLKTNVPMPSMPQRATYVMADGATGSPMTVSVTWGSLKADYR